MIADGKHPAKLFDITFGSTSSGAQLVSFVWDLTDCNERVSYAFAMTDSAGRPNRFAILVTRRWSLAWDGTDLDWFRAHREELLGTPALVQTRDEKFEWISPMVVNNETGNHPCPTSNPQPPNSTKSFHVKLVVDPAKLAEMPERIEPNFAEAMTLFEAITEGTAKLDADLVWTLIAAKVGPLQIDFGEPEWTEMIERIRRLKSWEGDVEV